MALRDVQLISMTDVGRFSETLSDAQAFLDSAFDACTLWVERISFLPSLPLLNDRADLLMLQTAEDATVADWAQLGSTQSLWLLDLSIDPQTDQPPADVAAVQGMLSGFISARGGVLKVRDACRVPLMLSDGTRKDVLVLLFTNGQAHNAG
ncbi:MAG: hypothetical protein JWL95_3239 [Gemmatimonadetes bacterium]|nr:hypothetical protein [Gemmatimonadota bacterium]